MTRLVRLVLLAGGALAACLALAGCGGPDMGTMTASPASIVSKAPVSLSFTYTAPASASTGSVQVVVPAGWTAPESTVVTGKGYTVARATTCTSAGVSAITGTGPWTVTVAVVCPASGQFTLTYGGKGAAAVRSPTMVGSATFATSAEFGGATTYTALATSPSVQVTTDIGSVSLSLSPSALQAGRSQRFSTATMTVTDLSGKPLAGRPPVLSGSSGQTFGTVADLGNGSYITYVFPTDTVGVATITATDNGVQGTAQLNQMAVASVSFVTPPVSLTVGTQPHLTIRAADPGGLGVPDAGLVLSVTGGLQSEGLVDNGDGTYTLTLLVPKTPSTASVTVTDGSVTATAPLPIVAGAPQEIDWSAANETLPADGTSHTALTAGVYDQYRNRVTAYPLSVAASGDLAITPATLGSDNQFHATVTASTTVGQQTLSFTAGPVTATGSITLIDPVPATTTVTLFPPDIAPDGASTTVAHIKVTNAEGQGLVEQPLAVTDDGGLAVGAVAGDNQGNYTATVGPASAAASVTVQAADGSAAGTAILAVVNPSLAWNAAGSLATARTDHTATLLPDGDVLVTGGYSAPVDDLNASQNGSLALASAELYHPATDSWSAAAPMATARANHTATLLANGKVLVTGGYGPSGPLASTELYSPATNTWSAGPALPGARWGQTATSLADGRVFVVGGSNTSTSSGAIAAPEIYDPTSNTWTAANPIGPAGGYARVAIFHTATLLPSGEVLVCPSAYGNGGYPIIYDPTSNEWFQPYEGNGTTPGLAGPAMPEAVLLDSGRVLLNGNGAAILISPQPGLQVSQTATGSPLLNLYSQATTKLGDGQVLVSGGHSYVYVPGAINPVDTITNATERYDPVTGIWYPDAPLLTARSRQTTTLLPDGSVLEVGGTGTSGVLASAERSSPVGSAPITISATASRTLLTADGTQSATVTFTVHAGDGTALAGQPLALALSGPGTLGPVTDNGDGTYTATYSTSTVAGPVTLTATDGTVSRQVALVAQAGAPAQVQLSLAINPVHVSGSPGGDGLTFEVTDAFGNPTYMGTITSITISGDATLSYPPFELFAGYYGTDYLPSHTIGDQTVTVTVTSGGVAVSGSVVVHQVS